MHIFVVATDTHVYVWLWIMRSEKLTVEHSVPGLNFQHSRQPQDNPQSGTIQIITCLLPSFLPYSPPLPSSSSPFSFSPLHFSFSPLHFSLTFPNPFLSFLPSLFPLLFSPPLCTRWAEVEGFFYSVASLLHVVPADMTEQFVDLLCQKISAGANHENGLFKLKLWVGEKKSVCLDWPLTINFKWQIIHDDWVFVSMLTCTSAKLLVSSPDTNFSCAPCSLVEK